MLRVSPSNFCLIYREFTVNFKCNTQKSVKIPLGEIHAWGVLSKNKTGFAEFKIQIFDCLTKSFSQCRIDSLFMEIFDNSYLCKAQCIDPM